MARCRRYVNFLRRSQLTVVFKRAAAIQGRLAKDRHAAVLCCSYDLFGRYLEYPELRADFYAITSRDEGWRSVREARGSFSACPSTLLGCNTTPCC